MMEIDASRKDHPRKVVISRSLDNTIQEVLDLISKHSISSWYETLTDDKSFVKYAQQEMWHVLERASRRMSDVDLVKFLSEDVLDCLHQHFKSIRLAKRNPFLEKPDKDPVRFWLHPWLRDDESELACLRKVSDMLLILLLSQPYAQCNSVRHLLRELVAGWVLKPTLDMICDPDYINLKILDYMAYREKLYADTKRTYVYSNTYEGFVKMIKSSESVADLKQMRYNIISEILQASTINNLKKQQGLNTEKDVAPKNTNKGELLKARNLERYKNQLTVAKQLCEKRLVSLGETIYDSEPLLASTKEEIPGQMVCSFSVIMEMPQGRAFFMKHLKKEGADSFLGFWNGVEKLKSTSKEDRHHMGSELYQQYISSPSTLVKVDKLILKSMEDFLRGDKGPDAFFTAQNQVGRLLEDQYYPDFIVSDIYFQLAALLGKGVTSEDGSITSDELFLDSTEYYNDEERIAGQSYHAQQQLRALDRKIENKTRALMAQKSSQKTEGSVKLQKVHEDMEKECDNLKQEKNRLEMHISRTQKWIDHIGQWKVHVYDAKAICTEEDKKVAQFVLLVSLSADEDQANPKKTGSPVEGWAISRTLEDFHALHEKLSQISPVLQKKDLPSSFMIFKSIDEAFVQKARVTLDEYLETVLKEDKVVHSEALYAFLSPTPEFVYQHTHLEKKSKFTLASLLKSLPIPNIRHDNQETDEDFMFAGDEGSREEKTTDSIAKPLYRLVDEVFELQGVFRWFRRSLISFVEMSFGRSINRQLKATVDWLVSEQMLIYYTQNFKESLWPGGEVAPETPVRTDRQQQQTRCQAKATLLQNVPEILKTLVGEDNGRRGVIKVFEVLQNKNLNKHLIYNLIELFLIEMLPEMKHANQMTESSHMTKDGHMTQDGHMTKDGHMTQDGHMTKDGHMTSESKMNVDSHMIHREAEERNESETYC